MASYFLELLQSRLEIFKYKSIRGFSIKLSDANLHQTKLENTTLIVYMYGI